MRDAETGTEERLARWGEMREPSKLYGSMLQEQPKHELVEVDPPR